MKRSHGCATAAAPFLTERVPAYEDAFAAFLRMRDETLPFLLDSAAQARERVREGTQKAMTRDEVAGEDVNVAVAELVVGIVGHHR